MRNGQDFFFFYFKYSLWFNIYLNINRIVTKNLFVFNHWRSPLAKNDPAFGSFHGKESEKEKNTEDFPDIGYLSVGLLCDMPGAFQCQS